MTFIAKSVSHLLQYLPALRGRVQRILTIPSLISPEGVLTFDTIVRYVTVWAHAAIIRTLNEHSISQVRDLSYFN